MKKLISMIALVAMVAMSSVAYAQTDTVDVEVTVASTIEVDMTAGITPCDSNAPSVSYAATLADLALEKTDTCTFQTTSTILWDLVHSDTDDNSECGGTSFGGIAGSTYATTGACIEGVSFPTEATGGTAGVGFYASSTEGHEDYCSDDTNVCAPGELSGFISMDEAPDVAEDWTFTFDVAVDDDPAQYADTYSDIWTITIAAS